MRQAEVDANPQVLTRQSERARSIVVAVTKRTRLVDLGTGVVLVALCAGAFAFSSPQMPVTSVSLTQHRVCATLPTVHSTSSLRPTAWLPWPITTGNVNGGQGPTVECP
jgi:hypothetical protein